MRYRVDFEHGWASYDEKDEDKARDLYKDRGIRLRICTDLHDEGTVIDGIPLYEDLSIDRQNTN